MPSICNAVLAAAVVALLLPSAASSQTWPSRPVTIMMPQPAGGIADLLARGTAQALSDEFGQPFIVENRAGRERQSCRRRRGKVRARWKHVSICHAGAGGLQQADVHEPALRSGARLRAGHRRWQIAGGLCRQLERAIKPAGDDRDGEGQARATHHWTDWRRLHEPCRLRAVAVEDRHRAQWRPLQGRCADGDRSARRPSAAGLRSAVELHQLAKEKKVRLLAVASAKRFGDVPDVPTVAEEIHQPFEAAAWFAIMARTGTPADIVQKVNAVTNRYLQSDKAKELIAGASLEPVGGSPAEAEAFIKRELDTWTPVIKAANISLN